jgi:methionyl-tRNA synthetase
MSPFMPSSSVEILRRLGVESEGTRLRLTSAAWQSSGERTMTSGPLLWPRLDDRGAVPSITSKENPVSDPSQPGPVLPAAPSVPTPAEPVAASQWPMEARISIDDFMRIDLRVARVLTAERVPNSKKLMKLEIDLGSERRTLVAGIAEAYEAAALVGRSVAIVANLKPAKLMGIESNGMVLAASPEGGKPMLVAFDEAPPPGSRVR